MKINLKQLVVRLRRSEETIEFSEVVTFLHGPISNGKSTVARLVDYCLGGNLERTPALQQEFVSATLTAQLGRHDCAFERSSEESSVRVTWSGADLEIGSVNAPLAAQEHALLDAEVYNLSDLIFHLCGIMPIKVRRASRDPDSPLIRLSFRDIWSFCYLEQTHLDSSFFRLEDPFRGRKTQDSMRFFTGLYSERLSDLETELMRAIDEQKSKREAVVQIRAFMARFELESEMDLEGQINLSRQLLAEAKERQIELEDARSAQTHPSDDLRGELRHLGSEIASLQTALAESAVVISEQKALRAEFITAKTKSLRSEKADEILGGVSFTKCPECGADISARSHTEDSCGLCGTSEAKFEDSDSISSEVLRRDLNERIDQLTDSIQRREREYLRTSKTMERVEKHKKRLDIQLQDELRRYDSAYIESIRLVEREIATLEERLRSLDRLQQMPLAISRLEEEAGATQGRIDRLRSSLINERERLRGADSNIAAIAEEFRRIMLSVSFPGVSDQDEISLDPRTWKPAIIHGDQIWTFWDAGSGGKKTLFNVCYALAIHAAAFERDMPVPSLLIIDSPTKNISRDENPELVRSLYAEIYRLAEKFGKRGLQFLLVDSDLVEPSQNFDGFSERRMAGEPGAPSLIPYYIGP